MIVVADTTPINYLILIGEIHVLEQLYGRIILPAAVREELLHPRAPAAVRDWVASSPSWVEILSPKLILDFAPVKLDRGEREAIALALELAADQMIVDEMRGRREAENRGFTVIGTLGVLEEASHEGLLDLKSAVEQLRRTNFHISHAVIEKLFGNGPGSTG